MEKQPSIKTLRNKADRLMQEKGRETFEYCECCSKPQQVMHHFFFKSTSSALRYDWDNLIPLCNGCHMKFHSNKVTEMNGLMVKKRGQEWFDDLMKRKGAITKVSKGYYLKQIDKLTI